MTVDTDATTIIDSNGDEQNIEAQSGDFEMVLVDCDCVAV